jgi:hypothetical protein
MKRLALAVALSAMLAAPAHANPHDADRVPVGFDLITRVVFGIPLTVAGAALFVPAAAVTAATRPSEMHKPYEMLVLAPVRYTWVDPLGYHPDPNKPRGVIQGE